MLRSSQSRTRSRNLEITISRPLELVASLGSNQRAGSRLIGLPQQRTVELRIEIVEQAINEQFDDIEVVVINNRFQVAVNPQVLGVVLSGPPSVLAELDVAQMRVVIDAEELEPSADDYFIEPTVEFDQIALGERVEIVALYPQRRINVHVFQQPARRRQI